MNTNVESVLWPDRSTKSARPLFLASVSAGFPSPAEDYIEGRLDLNRHLIKHPAATFFVRVAGDSMINAGIHPGDILVVDRALEPQASATRRRRRSPNSPSKSPSTRARRRAW